MKYLTNSGLSYFLNKIKAYISSVLPTKTSDLTNDSDFIDSNNLKTINNNSLVGTGNITITANSVDWDNVNNKPSTFTPSSHTHSASDITSGLATVATSGSYNDLSNKPTIPTVNNATLTIQKNGTDVKTFTANASSNVTCNITVPTKVSELTNNLGFISSEIDSSGTGWVRFKSGLQICWTANELVTQSSSGTWTYPKTFIATPHVWWQATGNNIVYIDTVNGGDRSPSSAVFIPTRYMNGSVVTAPYGVSGLAIGRWK